MFSYISEFDLENILTSQLMNIFQPMPVLFTKTLPIYIYIITMFIIFSS